MKKRTIRWLAVAAIFGGAVASSPSSPASADTMTPTADAPTVSITSTALTITPAYPRSSTKYEVRASVATNATLDDIVTVKLCFFKTTDNTPCSGELDGTTELEIVWTEDNVASPDDVHTLNSGFTITNPNTPATGEGATNPATTAQNYALAAAPGSYVDTDSTNNETEGSPTPTYDYLDTRQSMVIGFRFVASQAMAVGTWTARVTVALNDAVCGGDGCTALGAPTSNTAELENNTVNYFAAVLTNDQLSGSSQTSNINYGTVIADVESGPQVFDAFRFTANAASELTLVGTDFVRTTGGPDGDNRAQSADTLTLVTTVADVEEARITCFDTSDTAVTKTSKAVPTETPVDLDISRNASGVGTSQGSITCSVLYGGGANVALQTFANTVTIGIQAFTTPT